MYEANIMFWGYFCRKPWFTEIFSVFGIRDAAHILIDFFILNLGFRS